MLASSSSADDEMIHALVATGLGDSSMWMKAEASDGDDSSGGGRS
jgi:hypothetical protein